MLTTDTDAMETDVVVDTEVSAWAQLGKELEAEYCAAEATLKPAMAEVPDAAFVAWAVGAGFDAASMWASTRLNVAASNSVATEKCVGLSMLMDLVAAAPRNLGDFLMRRTSGAITVSVGGLTRSFAIAQVHGDAAPPTATTDAAPPTKSPLGNQGGTGNSSRIRIVAVRKPELAHMLNREFQRTGEHSAMVVAGMAAGLYTVEQYNSDRGENGRRNKAQANLGWLCIG